MKTIRLLSVLALTSLLALTAQAHDTKAPLNEKQIEYLADYEVLRAALAADDLAAAQKAGATISAHAGPIENAEKHSIKKIEAANKLTKAASLADAREAFKVLSKSAAHLASGKKGYYLAHCPMVPNEEGNWVQTSTKISNPYMGKSMLTCGSIEE